MDALPPRRDRRAALAALAGGFALTVVLGFLSDGFPEADDITHHLFARFAWRDGRYLLDTWGRPGFTILHAPLAPLGLMGSRLTSALLSAACAWLAYATAVRLGLRRTSLVPLLLYAQPMFTWLAYASLTETALAFYLILALWLWASGRPVWSAAVISLTAVTRYEAGIWLAVWGLALVARRFRIGVRGRRVFPPLPGRERGLAPSPIRSGEVPVPGAHTAPRTERLHPHPLPLPDREREPHPGAAPSWHLLAAVLLLLWAPVVHNVMARIVMGEFTVVTLLKPGGGVSFGSGTVFHYLVQWPWVVGYGLLPLGLGGLVLLPRRRGRRLLVAAVVVYFLTETVIYALGAFASGGYPRFLVPLCPVLAITACAAIDRILDDRSDVRGPALGAVALGLLLVVGAEVELRLREPDHVWWLLLRAGCLALGAGLVLAGALTWWRLRRGRIGRARRGLRLALGVLLVLAVVQAPARVRPHRLRPLEVALRDAARFVRQHRPKAPALSYHPWYVHFSGTFIPQKAIYPGGPQAVRRAILRAPAGTLVVWDAKFGPSDYFRLPLAWLDSRPELRLIWESDPRPHRVLVRVYETVPESAGTAGGSSD